MTFSEKIVKLRKIKGLTQDEFASAVGVSRQAVYKWESGQSYPEVAKLLEIKILFGISIDDLLDESFEVIMPEKKKRKRLSKALTKKIEEEVRAEQTAKEVVPAAVKEEEKEEPVKVTEELKTDAIPEAAKEEIAPVTVEEKKVEVAEEAEEEKTERRGFFRRLFGRR